MAADVLLYNALNANRRELEARSSNLDTTLTSCCDLCTALISCNEGLVKTAISCTSNNFNLWCLIPTGSGWTGGLKVCNTSTQFNCGFCCLWTVPAGVTCARFQLWGAGGGTGGGCCCSYSPWAGNGAYASVIMQVTAGQQYTVCAGCAYCCFSARAASCADGCPSWVSGPGLNNFCAEGGDAARSVQICRRMGPIAFGCCNYYMGMCQFNSNTDYCLRSDDYLSPGNGRGGPYNIVNPFYPSAKTYYGTSTSGSVYGVNGMYGFTRMGSPSPCVGNAPIYGFPACCCNCCLYNYNQGCCRSAQAGYMQIPGVSGWPGFSCGGANTRCGDMGRMGMVCICYK